MSCITIQDTAPKPDESYAWQPSQSSDASDVARVPTSSLSYTPLTTTSYSALPDSQPTMSTTSQSTVDHSKTNGIISSRGHLDTKDDELRLPSTQSPYITLLQKSRGMP